MSFAKKPKVNEQSSAHKDANEFNVFNNRNNQLLQGTQVSQLDKYKEMEIVIPSFTG